MYITSVQSLNLIESELAVKIQLADMPFWHLWPWIVDNQLWYESCVWNSNGGYHHTKFEWSWSHSLREKANIHVFCQVEPHSWSNTHHHIDLHDFSCEFIKPDKEEKEAPKITNAAGKRHFQDRVKQSTITTYQTPLKGGGEQHRRSNAPEGFPHTKHIPESTSCTGSVSTTKATSTSPEAATTPASTSVRGADARSVGSLWAHLSSEFTSFSDTVQTFASIMVHWDTGHSNKKGLLID